MKNCIKEKVKKEVKIELGEKCIETEEEKRRDSQEEGKNGRLNVYTQYKIQISKVQVER